MKKIIELSIGCLSVLLLNTHAIADESKWQGSYMGFSSGYGYDKQEITLSRTLGVITAGSNTVDKKGAMIGGIQGGHNWQNGNYVYGLELDFNPSAIQHQETLYKDWGYANDTLTTKTSVNWFSTLRGRAGILVHNNLLVYATGGLAIGRVNTTSQFTVIYPEFVAGNGTMSGQSSTTKRGWTLGAGTESYLTKAWSWKLEYLYTDLGSGHKCQCVSGTYWDGTPISYNVSNTTKFSSVKLGLNYKF